jgi:glycine cleavage system H protein
MSEIPSDRQYTAEHEWLLAGDPATVGITAHAAEALGDVVYLELPEVGANVTAGQVCGEIESTKSVSELFAPVDGVVAEVNDAAVADPSLVNSDPYGAGWLLKITATGTEGLISAEDYQAMVG